MPPFAALLVVLFLAGCPGRLRPAGTPVTVFVSGPLSLEDIAYHGALVEGRRASGACVWLVGGDALADRRAAYLTRGAAQVRLFEAAGADAVVLGPEWLEFGTGRLAELVGESRFQFLGANIVDSTGVELGHPFYVRQVNGAALGLTAVWADSADPRLDLPGVGLVAPRFAAGKVLPLLRRRAEVVGIAVRPAGPLPDGDADFAVGVEEADRPSVAVPARPGELARLEMTIDGERIADFRATAPVPAEAGPGVELRAVLDSVVAAVETLAGRPVTTAQLAIPATTLTNALVAGSVGKGVDGFLHDRPLFRDSLEPGPVTVGRVIDLLEEPGRAALVTLTGREVQSLLKQEPVQAGWRKGVTMVRMPLNKEYRLLATRGFLARHPEAAAGGAEPDSLALWERAVEVLGRTGQ